MRGLSDVLFVGILGCGLTACSSEGYHDASTAGIVWDVEGLESPRGELRAARPNLCAIAMHCKAIPQDTKGACAIAISDDKGPIYDGYAGVERRGRSSAGFPKANYSLELRERDGETDVPTDILGMGEDEDWLLDGMWADRSMLRNQLAYDLFANLDEARYAAEGRYCTLVLNGGYRGIYRIVERPKRDGRRISIPKDDGSGKSFVVRQDPAGGLEFKLGLEDHWSAVYPKDGKVSRAQLEGMQTWFDELASVMKARSEDGALFEFLDRADLIDWVLIQEFAKNIDAYKLSVHLYKAPGEPARMVPWDMDLAFGQPLVTSDAPEPADAHESSGWVGERTAFIRDIIAVEGFPAELAARWHELRKGPLADETVFALIDGYIAAMQPELDANVERWPLDAVTFAAIYPPYSFPARASYAAEVEALRTWIAERSSWISDHIETFDE